MSMVSGQRVLLSAGGSVGPAVVRVVISWDTPKRKTFFARVIESIGAGARSAVSIETLAILFDREGENLDTVWSKKLYSDDGFVQHLGCEDRRDESIGGILKRDVLDDLAGKAQAGAESIVIDLARIPRGVEQLIFTASSFTSEDLTRVANTHFSVCAEGSSEVIAQYAFMGDEKEHNSRIMAKLSRTAGDRWEIVALGATSVGRTLNDLVSATRPHLRP